MKRSAGGRRWSTVVFLVVALVFVALLLQRQWTSLDAALAGIREFRWVVRPGWLALALVLAVADLVVMGSVWVRLFHRIGGSVPWWTGVRIWVVTNFGRYIPGKVWQLGGLAAFLRDRGDSGAAGLVSALVFQVVSLVTGVAIALATIGSRWLIGGMGWMPAASILVLLLAIGLHPGVIRAMSGRLAGLLGEPELEIRLTPRDIGGAAVGMLVAWVLYGAGFVSLMSGIGVVSEASGLPMATGVFAASYVIGYAALIAPGGLVVREGAMAGLLAELGRLPVGVAAAVAIVARLWVLASEMIALALVAVPRNRVERGESAN